MTSFRQALTAFVLMLLLLSGGSVANAAIPAPPTGPVLDQANVLPPAEEAALDQKLRTYNSTTGRSVIVATVSSLDGLDVVTYAQQLVEAWNIGGKETEKGVLLLVAPTERKVRIATARGVQYDGFNDILAARIIRDTITPRFKAGDMAGGIAAGVDAIVADLNRTPAEAKAIAEAEAAATAQRSSEGKGGTIGGFIFWIAMIGVFMVVFGRGGRRGKRYSRGGNVAGAVGEVILWSALNAAMNNDSDRGGGFGGFGGGGGGGGGGFGGFGGGGGGFNGGGASGGW